MAEPIPAEQVVGEPIKRKRGRPKKSAAPPPILFDQLEPQWPCRVKLVTARGTEEFGCSRVSVQNGFFVFETDGAGVVSRRYEATETVLRLQTIENRWPQTMGSSGYIVYNGLNSGIQTTPSSAPLNVTGPAPQEFSARNGLRTMMSPAGPVSEVNDGNGPAVAGAGFMS